MANPALCEVVKEIRDQLADFEIDERFFSVMLQCLKSLKFPLEAKMSVCELIVEIFEKEIQYLNDQIQSYEFRDPKKFLETLPPSKQEIIELPVDICIQSLQLEACIEELGKQIEFGFFDPIAVYMEKKISLSDRSDCLLHNQTRYVPIWLSAFTSVSWWKHSQAASLSQLLDWLIWHCSIT